MMKMHKKSCHLICLHLQHENNFSFPLQSFGDKVKTLKLVFGLPKKLGTFILFKGRYKIY